MNVARVIERMENSIAYIEEQLQVLTARNSCASRGWVKGEILVSISVLKGQRDGLEGAIVMLEDEVKASR